VAISTRSGTFSFKPLQRNVRISYSIAYSFHWRTFEQDTNVSTLLWRKMEESLGFLRWPHRERGLHSSYKPEYRQGALKKKKKRRNVPSVWASAFARVKTCVLDSAREHTFSLIAESFPPLSFLSMPDVARFANSLTEFADSRGNARARGLLAATRIQTEKSAVVGWLRAALNHHGELPRDARNTPLRGRFIKSTSAGFMQLGEHYAASEHRFGLDQREGLTMPI